MSSRTRQQGNAMTSAITDFRPDYATHPGEVLAETLAERAMSQTELAAQFGVPETDVAGLIEGSRSLDEESALSLQRLFAIPARLWLNLQRQWDTHKRNPARTAKPH